MHRKAQTAVPIHPLLAERWSSRAFSDDPVAPELVLSLLEAARWSASCFNGQPWRFIVATRDDPEQHARLAACFTTSNQRWVPRAWVVMIALAVDTFEVDGSANRLAQYDVGLAVQNMVVQASAHGLNVRQAAGIDIARIRAEYAVPEGVTVMCGVMIGYPGDPDTLVDPLPQRERQPRTRKPLSELCFSGRFGQAYDGLPDETR
ncbi:MAG: nitroreductase family protein [Chloroflexi bacterium]|nr:MAG: putative nitroreductase [Chloroflexi bacterium OLB13]MBC6955811.1 nitroreductase [Chloroflexota bacterium]MBV6437303.1 malonic semialdehyde reductase RutE [Anaerolineae bacterium]MDL1915340.1 nitroreductase [Anaerolineae bacterium CFX4]MBW7878041.1 nitroreductase family protein [Anaerolineae bacterium]